MANPIKVQAVVDSIECFGPGVFRLDFKPSGRIPKFKPGQFLHLALDDYDPTGGFWPESRVFSIASNNANDRLTIVFSVKGKFTKRMEECLTVGKVVWLKLPYGDFIIDSSIKNGQDVVLIAGGTGVSPYVPFLEGYAHGDYSADRKVLLHYGARLRPFILFQDILFRCVEREGFSLHLTIEDEPPDGLAVEGAILEKGRLNIGHIKKDAEGLENPAFFISGPPIMIKDFKQALLEMGIFERNIKIDEWE
jgi:NAD(P)H-flavin reductase